MKYTSTWEMNVLKILAPKVLIFNAALFLSACGLETGTEVTVRGIGNVEGTVTEVSTGTPLSGATVQIGDRSDVTGINGVYSIQDLNVGKRTMTATKTGYQIYSSTVEVIKGTTVTHNIQMTQENSAPIANAGPDQNISTGSPVTLDASGSTDPDGNPLTYRWAFVSTPAGSTAALSDVTAINPTFIPNVDGIYELSLMVNDGTVNSEMDFVTITSSTVQWERAYGGAGDEWGHSFSAQIN